LSVPFDLIAPGTSFTTAGSALIPAVELPLLDDAPEPPPVVVVVLLLLLPQPATSAMQTAAIASASQLLKKRI
jgi:hypothetical protein